MLTDIMNQPNSRCLQWFLVGAGGHALVVYDALRASGWTGPVMVGDDRPGLDPGRFPGAEFHCPALSEAQEAGICIHIAIGDNRARKAFHARLRDAKGDLAIITHPKANHATSSVIEPGVFAAAGSIAGPLARIGRGSIINHNAVVDHECIVGEWCHIAPGAVLGGRVCLEEGVLVGAGAVILPGRHIGAWARIGAGAVVTRDIPPNETVIGIPAERHVQNR